MFFRSLLEGSDSRLFTIPAAPSCTSSQIAGEMAELYWQSLTRDAPFSRWVHDATIAAGIADLAALGLPVDAKNLFRIPGKEVLAGPYVSQFLTLPVPAGNMLIDQRYVSTVPGQSFGVTHQDWLALQNGISPSAEAQIESSPRYISTPRG